MWWSVDAALRPQEEIERLVAPYLGGDDPIFGFRTPLRLEEFFDGEKLRAIAPDPEAEMNILVGTGAALAGWQGELVYIDIPKNEIQFRSRAGSIANLGATQPAPPKKMYKRFYFVDWVVLNRHKKELLPRIGIIVDGQREGRSPGPRAPTCAAAWSTSPQTDSASGRGSNPGRGEANGSANTSAHCPTTCPTTHGRSS